MNTTEVHILHPRSYPTLRLGYSHFYPLKKWEKEFKKEGIYFEFFKHHFNEEKLLHCDILIVDWRYYDLIDKGHYSPNGFSAKGYHFLDDMLKRANNRGIYKILYDSADSGGTRAYDVISRFDSVLKKQKHKKQHWYTKEDVVHRSQVWLPDKVEELPRFANKKLTPSDVDKIKVGWNIGMSDYRYFPNWFYKLRIAGDNIFPQAYRKLPISKVDNKRHLLFSYRSKTKDNKRYSYNRMKLLNELNQAEDALNEFTYALGGRVSKNEYLKEQQHSKIGLSPFGWGEICYRDFEIMLNGGLIVKPSMEHLETWPDYFLEGETYIPTKWNYSDLIPKLIEIEKNWGDYKGVARKAQQVFLYYQQSASEFITHFKKLLNL